MPSSPIVTAYRDALRRNEVVTKEEYITQVQQSSLSAVKKTLSIIELQLAAWEFYDVSQEYYVEQDLERLLEQLKGLRLEEDQDESSGDLKWRSIDETARKPPLTFVSFTTAVSHAVQPDPDEIRTVNLIRKVESLLKEIQKRTKKSSLELFVQLLDTVSDAILVDSTEFMRVLISFRQFCQNDARDRARKKAARKKIALEDKDNIAGGSDDWVQDLRIYFQELADMDLVRTYKGMRSPEVISLVNAFFTQQHIQMYDENLDNPAFKDALSVWEVNKKWVRNDVLGMQGLDKSTIQTYIDGANTFVTGAAQFYTTIVSVYDVLCETMEERHLRGYTFELSPTSQQKHHPKPRCLYLESQALEYVAGVDPTSPADESCALSQFSPADFDLLWSFIQPWQTGRDEDAKTAKAKILSLKNKEDHYLRESFNNVEILRLQSFLAKMRSAEATRLSALLFETWEKRNYQLCYIDFSGEQQTITRQDCESLGLRKETIKEFCLALQRGHAKPSELIPSMKPYLHDVILKLTHQRGHTIPSDASPYLSSWPTDEQGRFKKIVLSPAEKRLMGECVRANNIIDYSKRRPIPKKPYEEYVSRQQLGTYNFGRMIQSLGGYFNPNSFIDLVLVQNIKDLETSLETATTKQLRQLHKQFTDSDLNDLMILLRRVKEGGISGRQEIYQWFSIRSPSVLDEPLQIVVDRLYTNADKIMQSVRQKLKITEDYAYTNLELSAAQARTGKNEACFKRLLQKYVGASPQKDFSFSMWDYLYNFFHWGAKLKEAESLPDDPLSALVTPLVTPSPTPFGTPTGVEANMWSPDSRNIQKDAAASPAKVCPFPNITFERA